MEEYENNKQELEDVCYAIDCIESAISTLEKHKIDFEYDIKSLKDVLDSCEYIANETEQEIAEQEQEMSDEYRDELACANIEFERSRL